MRPITPLLAIALLSLAAQGAPAPFPKSDTGKADLAKMQGTWERVSNVYVDSRRAAWVGFPGLTFKVRGSGMTDDVTDRQDDKPPLRWTFTLDARKRPKAIDLKPAEGRFKGRQLRGVYSLDGDSLMICWAESDREVDRPKDLTSKQPGQWLEVFKRVKR
jgi:uncharacterized protein (TIGR03067 family)